MVGHADKTTIFILEIKIHLVSFRLLLKLVYQQSSIHSCSKCKSWTIRSILQWKINAGTKNSVERAYPITFNCNPFEFYKLERRKSKVSDKTQSQHLPLSTSLTNKSWKQLLIEHLPCFFNKISSRPKLQDYGDVCYFVKSYTTLNMIYFRLSYSIIIHGQS
jgi:hypothetical protein